nr:uncharacterized protein LOC106824489 isoform X2 [Equus asinus]
MSSLPEVDGRDWQPGPWRPAPYGQRQEADVATPLRAVFLSRDSSLEERSRRFSCGGRVLSEARGGKALGARRALKDRCGPGPEGLRREAGPPLVRPAAAPRAEPGREGRRAGRWRPLRCPSQSLRVTFETFPQKEKQFRCASPVAQAPRLPVLRTCDPAVWLKESTMSGNTMIVSNVEKSSVNIHVLRHTELRMERTLMRIISMGKASLLCTGKPLLERNFLG